MLNSSCIVATENQIWLNDSWFQSRSSTHCARWVIKQQKYSTVAGTCKCSFLWSKAFTLLLWVCIPSKEYINVLDKKWWYTSILGMFSLPWPRSSSLTNKSQIRIISSPLYYKPVLCSTSIVSAYDVSCALIYKSQYLFTSASISGLKASSLFVSIAYWNSS